MMTKDEAYKLRAIIEKAAISLDDKTASEGAVLFPRLKQDGSLVEGGTRINWGGIIKRARTALWDTPENDPDHAPTLWEDIAYKDGYRIIPQTITAENPFAQDECGWWEETLYRSIYDGANVWTPVQYPDGWEVVG